MKQGKLFVLSSPSGGGKSTIIHELRTRNPSLSYSISATTRPPRKNEKDGVDYHFIDKKVFDTKKNHGEFIEWAVVHGFYYGTYKKDIDNLLERGENILLDIDVQGGLELKNHHSKPVLIFLKPPSWEILTRRLEKRGTEDIGTLNKRLEAARSELEMSNQYDFIVINDILNETIKEIEVIIDKFI